jgi:LppP/LprE lipoprotein
MDEVMGRRRRWPMRVAGLLGTSALLGTGVAIAMMVVPRPNDEAAVPVAPAATPAADERAQKRPRKPKLTPAQRRARREAVATLTREGYEPVRLKDYKVRSDLKVLIGRPATDDRGPLRAFFFAGGEFVGYDSEFPSSRLRVVRAGERAVTLAYGIYEAGDRRCCPGGGLVRVRFRWDGAALAPSTAPPDPFVRVPAG